MNQLNEALHSHYKPSLALVVYRAATGENEHPEWSEYYLESHAINEAGQLMEGKPLQAETIAGIVQVFRDRNMEDARITGAIPSGLIHYTPMPSGDYRMIWHRPACQKMVHFADETKLKSGLAMVPPLLFIASAAHLSVFSLASGKRPGAKSRLLHAPFHNVDHDGRVCLGSAKVKVPVQKTFENLIAYWEEMWWGSKFIHSHNGEAVKGGLQKVWRSQLAKPTKPFPTDLLNDTKRTYQQLINGRQN